MKKKLIATVASSVAFLLIAAIAYASGWANHPLF